MCDIFVILFEEKVKHAPVGQYKTRCHSAVGQVIIVSCTHWLKNCHSCFTCSDVQVFIILPHRMLQNFKLRVQFRTFGFIRLEAKKNLFCFFVIKLFVLGVQCCKTVCFAPQCHRTVCFALQCHRTVLLCIVVNSLLTL